MIIIITIITDIGLNKRSEYIKSYLNSKGKKMLLEVYAITGFFKGSNRKVTVDKEQP